MYCLGGGCECNSLITIIEQPSELEVVSAISSLNQWFELGQQLEIPYDVLEVIEIDCDKHGTKRQRSKMVHTWLQREPAASWSKLCGALDRMGEKALAQDIREKHFTGEHCACSTNTCYYYNTSWKEKQTRWYFYNTDLTWISGSS